jgi:hypothetical protein
MDQELSGRTAFFARTEPFKASLFASLPTFQRINAYWQTFAFLTCRGKIHTVDLHGTGIKLSVELQHCFN